MQLRRTRQARQKRRARQARQKWTSAPKTASTPGTPKSDGVDKPCKQCPVLKKGYKKMNAKSMKVKIFALEARIQSSPRKCVTLTKSKDDGNYQLGVRNTKQMIVTIIND
eukprot:TRINITY_DN15354_c0_g1_i1.p3 TRINITY_DN15354_c0_g1~~TRINITY_DN15354_c0_g1_i1.p3  ORF type:complete len:110 (-),score=16.53 TRINITY_DN15354_c0_g1_i1:89-418(-)